MKKWIPFFVGLCIVVIWGVSFICSKNLVSAGLVPNEVYFLRACISYLCLLAINHKRFASNNLADEGVFVMLGVFGGSLYYVLENMSLLYTYTTNVSLIVSESPLLTMLLAAVVYKARTTRYMYAGAALALVGMVLLVFNGEFVYNVRWLGDSIALAASFSWAVYSLLIKKVSGKYEVAFITRKVFFYGMITVAPLFFLKPFTFPLAGLLNGGVLFNLLFLAVLSSFACFLGWTFVVGRIGAVRASNIVYLSPVFTFLASYLFLREAVTVYSVTGAFLILFGVFFSEKGGADKKNEHCVERKATAEGQ